MQSNQNTAAAEPVLVDSLYLPTLPPVVSRVIHAITSKEVSVEEVAEILAQDRQITAFILRVSNSSHYRLADPAMTVAESIGVLGMKTVSALVLASSLINQLWMEDTPGFNHRRFWYHSVACMILTEAIASKIAYAEPEKAFIAGFIHDIGKIIIIQNLPDHYRNVIALMKTRKIYLWKAEREVLGFHHGDTAACLLKKWQLPQSLGEAAQYHHEPDQAKNESLLCHIVRLSDAMSHFAFPVDRAERITPPLYRGLWEPLGLNEDIVRKLLARRSIIQERLRIFIGAVGKKPFEE